ncbi:MAG: hypothetical protein KY476_10565 [Planctomycetes bacterium]|nr:hypothetical protein [Planctomycetota bacterium]
MIELKRDRLVVSFPEVHPLAHMSIDFQRTLRIPDDDRDYPLPPGLGCFPLRHVDEFASRVPGRWLERGGVMLPMYQAEALWLNFDAPWHSNRGTAYPFAVKVAAGKINAVTGEPWTNGLGRRPQDYAVVPEQPWLDGYAIEKGVIRQFVAMPLGEGYTAEEQITGTGEHGGLQLILYPMKAEVFERRFPKRVERLDLARKFAAEPASLSDTACFAAPDMGLAPGGRMRQEIYDDPFRFDDWDTEHFSRCFVHIANSQTWQAITGSAPPFEPPTAADYTRARLPWFEYYDESARPLPGADVLRELQSVAQKGRSTRRDPLPENESVEANRVVHLRRGLNREQVREGTF